MQVRQKSGHFSAVLQVVLSGSQHDWPPLEPPVQVQAPLVQLWFVVQVWLPPPPPVPVVSGVPQAAKKELATTKRAVRRVVMVRTD
jgi:hypothetical protein